MSPPREPIPEGRRALREGGFASAVALGYLVCALLFGVLLVLERNGVLSADQRELVIDRAMALDLDEVALDDLKWVVLMVLFNQPGSEAAFAWMESQIFAEDPEPVH